MDTWTIIHRYRQLVRDGKAAPLLCPDCGKPVTVTIGPDDEPMLWCVWESTLWQPGINVYDSLRAVVSEFFLD